MNKITDSEMDKLLEQGDPKGLQLAAMRDPSLIARGWRDGVCSWVYYASAFSEYEKLIPALLELGADIDGGKSDFPEENALHAAVVDGDIRKVKFLLGLGANTRKKPNLAWSAVVATKNQLELVKLLDQYGGDIHYVDEGGFSGRYANPLSLAKDYGLDDVVAYLESRGCVMPPSGKTKGPGFNTARQGRDRRR